MNRGTVHAVFQAGVALTSAATGGCMDPGSFGSALGEAIFRDPRLLFVGGNYCAVDPLTRRDVEAEPGAGRAIPAEPSEPMDEFFEAGWGLYDITQARWIVAALTRSRPSIVFVLYDHEADAPAAAGLVNRVKAAGLATAVRDPDRPVRKAEDIDSRDGP